MDLITNLMKKKRRNRWRRHRHVRHKVFGTKERPRLCVYRSLKHIYAQIIDDIEGHTLCAASTLTKEIREKIQEEREKAKQEGKKFTKKDEAAIVGEYIAKLAKEKGIEKVCFDRGGFKYHGRVAALADGARKGGLKF